MEAIKPIHILYNFFNCKSYLNKTGEMAEWFIVSDLKSEEISIISVSSNLTFSLIAKN